MQRNVDGDQMVPSAKIRKRRIGMTKNQTQLQKVPPMPRSTETTSKMSSKPELSKAPKHTEVYPRDTTL